jgi:hypothetical protein
MAWDITVILEDKPGTLADMGEALGNAGINIKGGCGLPFQGQGIIHLLVDDPDAAIAALDGAGIEARTPVAVIEKKFADRPGELGELTRRVGNAGVNVNMFYLSADGEIVLGVDDVEKARAQL